MPLPLHALPALATAATTLVAATPSPTPEPAAATGPGIAGFLVTFALVLACIPLFLSMTRKVRGVRYRDPEESGPAGAPGTGRDDGVPPGPDGAGRPGPAAAPRP